jgi:hypothetical protein
MHDLGANPWGEGAMNPSKLRELILADHAALRGQAKALTELLLRAERSARAVPPAVLGARIIELCRAVQKHMTREDELLLPFLETVDAWGPERGARFRREHASQRALLRDVRQQVASGDAQELRRAGRDLVAVFLSDFEDEEALFLSAELLRDDSVVVAQATD